MSNKKDNIIRGGQFIVHETSAKDVFTPEDFTEEQSMMRDSVIEFVEKEIVPNKAKFEQRDYALTENIMRKAGELGLFGVSVAVDCEGWGVDCCTTLL